MFDTQGHTVGEQQMRLSQQHYLDQLPAPQEEEAPAQESSSALHVEWEADNGADTAVITGDASP